MASGPKAKAKAKAKATKSDYRRDAWRPVAGSTPPARFVNSRFGGPAMLLAGEALPRCSSCEAPLDQLLQLVARDLPDGASWLHGDDVLQFFRCPGDDCDADDYEAFSDSHLVRIVTQSELLAGLRGASPAATGNAPLAQRTIRSWQRIDDHPSVAEQERLRIDDASSKPCSPFDKLGGWPSWCQGVEYPSCPTCGTEMTSVFQLASEDNLPISLGDLGVGHITQCPKHPAVLGFAWASS